MDLLSTLGRLIQGGLGNLAAYLAAHVLLCLVPAFFIAGGLAALIPKESITRFLGRKAPKYVSYPASALAGSVLAVCSCTIVPLFAGIYKKGAGIGPAITFLFFAPAANILALAYTGGVIGVDLAVARLLLSLTFGIGIGLIMALLFHRDELAREQEGDEAMGMEEQPMRRSSLLFLLMMVVLLLAGTLKLDFLTRSYASLTLPIPGVDTFQGWLHSLVPFDPAKGEEGVSAQGSVLIVLLLLIALTAWRGLQAIEERMSPWTWAALGLIALTLLVAAVGMSPEATGLTVQFTGKFFAVVLSLAVLAFLGGRYLAKHDLQEWLAESWRFVKQIFPLLITGVFVVGIIRQLIRPEWIEAVAGRNSLLGNLAGVAFGVFMYFPTLVEVPIANMFLSMGMHRGPLLAYLMADPELSLESILIVSVIIGRLKTWTYVAWVALFSTLAGLAYGAWYDGTSIWFIGMLLAMAVGLLALALTVVSRRRRAKAELAVSDARHGASDNESEQCAGEPI